MLSVICQTCGVAFMRHKSQLARGYKNSFCSRACRDQHHRSMPMVERFDKFCIPEPNSGCYLWIGPAQKCTENYWQARFDDKLAGRVAWQLKYGDIPPGLCVLHKCDNPMCVCPEHLFLGTRKENTMDMMRKGRNRQGIKLGEAHPKATVTDDLVRAVRAFDGPPIAISRALKISRWVVYNILKNRTWRHVS
jgi:hypothetical protein